MTQPLGHASPYIASRLDQSLCATVSVEGDDLRQVLPVLADWQRTLPP